MSKNNFQKHFDELRNQAIVVENSMTIITCDAHVDEYLFLSWNTRVKNLLSIICGEESQYFHQFEKNEDNRYESSYSIFRNLQAIFLAVKEDFEGGYLLSTRILVQAEVFDSELEQANELLTSGYYTAAAVIAGVVLETALRELCDNRNIEHGKLDKMNADLAKAGAYNKLMQKRITVLADIRNNAAHGKQDGFNKEDVTDMIDDIKKFLANHLVN